jgi:hypothetical protein
MDFDVYRDSFYPDCCFNLPIRMKDYPQKIENWLREQFKYWWPAAVFTVGIILFYSGAMWGKEQGFSVRIIAIQERTDGEKKMWDLGTVTIKDACDATIGVEPVFNVNLPGYLYLFKKQ